MEYARLAELADKTADEIERRGWVSGNLADGIDYYITGADMDTVTVTGGAENLDICKVCALGGMGVAFYGNPLLGYKNDHNGYVEFVEAVTAWLYANNKIASGTRWKSWNRIYQTVFRWNDRQAEEEVVEAFRAMANEWRDLA